MSMWPLRLAASSTAVAIHIKYEKSSCQIWNLNFPAKFKRATWKIFILIILHTQMVHVYDFTFAHLCTWTKSKWSLGPRVYFHHTWDWGFLSCYISASFRYLVSYVEWISVAWIAFIRCILVTQNEYFKNVLKSRNRKILILLTWIYGLILLMPTFLEVVT